MRQLFEFLRQNPLIALIVIGWIFSAVGGAITKARRQAAQQAKRPPRGGSRAPAPPQRAAGRPSPEQVAAEMRRILGMEEPPRPLPQRPAPPAAPRPSSFEAPSPERAPTPLQPSTLGRLPVHVDPHVGDRIEKRQAPATGAVGAQVLGGLGGRAAQVGRRRRMASSLVDLHDLPRALVMREVLDQPLSLRRGW